MSVIFLISLPRSGSTLAQRAICTSLGIRSAPEPWLLLPLVSSLTNDLEVASSYSYANSREALEDFLKGEKREQYYEALREFVERMYGSNEEPFLDKTPRNSLIISELIKVFPDANIIVLTRNPISIINSIIGTWGENGKRWRLRPYFIDLFQGLPNIIKLLKSEARHLHIRYEDLVTDPETTLIEVSRFLNLPIIGDINLNESNLINGKFGDKQGIKKYNNLSINSLSNSEYICNFYRQWWVKKYLNYLGSDSVETLGYEYKLLVHSVSKKLGLNYIARDILEELFQFLKILFPLRRLRRLGIKKFIISSEMR